MKALRTNGCGAVWLQDAEEPEPADGQVKIRAACSLVSGGTEFHYAFNLPAESGWRQLGYCSSGFVESIRGHGSVFQPGDRVIAMGWNYAVHAEAIVVPQKLVVPVPPSVQFDAAVFANLAATAQHAVHRAGSVRGKWSVVIGAGLVGQLVARLITIHGGRVVLIDRVPERLEFSRTPIRALQLTDASATAREVLDITSGEGAGVIFLCTAGPDGFPASLCLDMMSRAPDGNRRGVLVAVGRFPMLLDIGAEAGNIDIRIASRCGTGYRDDAYAHGRTSYDAPPGEATVDSNLAACLAMIEKEQLSVNELVSHRFPFHNAPAAYELIKERNRTMGIMFDY